MEQRQVKLKVCYQQKFQKVHLSTQKMITNGRSKWKCVGKAELKLTE